MDTTLPVDKIQQLGELLKQQKKHAVLVGGCFDLFHYGHITLLEEAKKQADVLIVLLESDERIRKLKGSERPLHTQKQRAHMLIALRSVDYVILLPKDVHDSNYDMIVKQIQPAIIATTKDSSSLRYIEKQAADSNAEIYLVDPIENLSTSRIVAVVAKEL